MIFRRKKSVYAQFYPYDSPEARRISSILLGIGLLILALSLFFTLRHALLRDQLVEVEAVVERVTGGRNSATFVSYEYDGELYQMVRHRGLNPGYPEGASVTVKIHPDHPGKTVSGSSIFFLVFSLFYTAAISVFWLKCHFPVGRQSIQSAPAAEQHPPAPHRNSGNSAGSFGRNW